MTKGRHNVYIQVILRFWKNPGFFSIKVMEKSWKSMDKFLEENQTQERSNLDELRKANKINYEQTQKMLMLMIKSPIFPHTKIYIKIFPHQCTPVTFVRSLIIATILKNFEERGLIKYQTAIQSVESRTWLKKIV